MGRGADRALADVLGGQDGRTRPRVAEGVEEEEQAVDVVREQEGAGYRGRPACRRAGLIRSTRPS